MATTNTLTIFVTPVIGEEICIEKACTLKQAVTLAKKEARKMINNGGMWVTINIQARASYGVETLAHIEAEKEGRRVVFSDETPAETYAVCWGDEYKEEDGENNVIAETTDESEAREIALNESRENGCAMSVVRMSDKTAVLVISDSIGLAPEAAAAYDALCSSFVDTYQPEPTNPDNTPTTMNANETTAVSVSVTDNGNKCEYAANGKTLAAITYRKEFDAYDVNTPTVGYMTANVTEAHKACESGVNWLLGHNATFDYSAVEEYNAKPYAEI